MTQTTFDEDDARYSSDARWIVYSSDESGRREIYVRPFTANAQPSRRISWDGRNPQWSADGKWIYYRAQDGTLMELAFRTDVGLQPWLARRLFPIRGHNSEFEIVPNRQFLVDEQASAWSSPPPVVLNWRAALAGNE
jgi:WD40 repeat protein